MNINKREIERIYIDVIKGIAIFLMIWGHCIQYCLKGSDLNVFENGVFKFIYSFHMPLFMLVSGYLFFFSFQKRELKELIVHRSKPLLFSIVFCGFFNYYISTGVKSILQGNFSALISGEWMSSLADLWFLWSVLISSVCVAVICKKIKNVSLQIILLCIASVVFFVFPGINLNLFMYPFFIIGFYFAKYKDKISQKLISLKYASIILFPLMLMFYEEKHYIYTSGIIGGAYSIKEYIFIDAFRYAIGLIGSIFVLTVVGLLFKFTYTASQKLSSVRDNGYIFKRLSNIYIYIYIGKIGKNSLQIYCLSNAMLSGWLGFLFPILVEAVGYNMFTVNMTVYNFVITPLLALLYCVGLYGVVKLFDKIKLSRILFGR